MSKDGLTENEEHMIQQYVDALQLRVTTGGQVYDRIHEYAAVINCRNTARMMIAAVLDRLSNE